MRADRLLSLLLLIQNRGKMTAAALAEELGVSRRTILRDVDALSFAGVPVYTDGGHGGGISIDERYRITLTGMKQEEVLSLFVSNNSQALEDLGLGKAAENTLLKLFSALPRMHQPPVNDFRQRIHLDPTWLWRESTPPAFWDDLQRAVFEDRRIRVLYRSYRGEPARRLLDPYSLVNKGSFWYLIAKRDGDFRIYRVSRFQEIEVIEERFERDPEYDLAIYWRNHVDDFGETLAGYRCTLRFAEDRLPFARSLVPGRYVVEDEAPNGAVTVSFQLESLDLATMLVFGIGPSVEILGPPGLREAFESAVGQFRR